MDVVKFTGFIKDVKYQAFLTKNLGKTVFSEFDINNVASAGKIITQDGEVAYSKWVSPKRTRTYPFERLYNTINSPVRLTVIPIIKDEGADGDLDRIQYSTISWMNLLNIYIVLAYYDKAEKNLKPRQAKKDKITNQQFELNTVNEQIQAISQYKQSALHWNRSLVEEHFVELYQQALNSYAEIANQTGVKVHDPAKQQPYIQKLLQDFENFKEISLRGSKGASSREAQTEHDLEYLSDGAKATFEIKNYLGGIYYLTADEVIFNRETASFIIQESKNSSKGFLPGLSDIKDGLFKLILYSNLHRLELNGEQVEFTSRLKLTGKKVVGSLNLPCEQSVLDEFLEKNKNHTSEPERSTMLQLNQEAMHNKKLEIQISSNQS